MPKKRTHNRNNQQNIASIVQRLPVHRHMNQSQAALVKLSPTWLAWSANNLTKELAAQTILSSLQNGQLVISCASAVSASQIKHQQSSLLESLKLNGFSNVTRIKIRIDHYDNKETLPNQLRPHRQTGTDIDIANKTANTELKKSSRKSPSPQTIKSIEHCQNLTSNDELAESLKRLASTLKELD